MKRSLLIAILLIYSIVLSAQSPSYFNYQSVIHNAEGELVTNQNINFRFYILEGTPSGPTIYSETQLVKSNNFGVCSIKVGTGGDASGSLGDIDWGNSSYFLRVEADITGGTTFIEIGTVQLLAVPYSLYSAKSQNAEEAVFALNAENAEESNHSISSDHAANSDYSFYSDTANVAKKLDEEVLYFTNTDTLFAVKDRNGNLVFAVFPDGARVYVNEGVKGRVGGFAVTGRNPGKAIPEEDYILVTPDSTRVWVNEEVKGRVGGFAVTGRNPRKGMSGDYLVVTSDSTRVYINDTTTTKGKVGGFAVTGRNPRKGPFDDYLHVTSDSTRVYVTESESKGPVGGFAVTGRNPGKGGITSDYFNVSGNTSAEIVNNENRVMWYPQKSALLAGEVHVGSNDSVGTNSTALGYRTIAKGEQSQSFGYQTKALGDYSTAIGKNAIANSLNSFAFGENAQANNEESYAIGREALAQGFRSFAFGSAGIDSAGTETNPAKALGDYSFAIGQGSVSGGFGSIALGLANISTGQYSIAAGYKSVSLHYGSAAIGYSAEATGEDGSVAIGYNTTASGNYGSTALGYITEASGDLGATALGAYSTASGHFSTALGSYNEALGQWSTAIGSGNNAEGELSIAIGSTGIASGSSSVVIGNHSIASGTGAFAIGIQTTASGNYSTAMGFETIAPSMYETAIGAFNTNYTPISTNQWKATDRLFVIGNGTYNANRSDALVLLKNGNLGLGTPTPNAKLDIVATGDGANILRLSTEREWAFQQEGTGASTSLRLRNLHGPDKYFHIDTDGGISTRSADGATTYFRINHSTGAIGIGTNSPSSLLHLSNAGDAVLTIDADTDNSGEEDNPQIALTQDGGSIFGSMGFVGASGQLFSNSITNGMYLINHSNGYLQIGTNNTADITINSSGNVGVGTTSPAYKLDVMGEIAVRPSNAFRIRGTDYSTIFRQDSWGFYILLTDNGDPDGSINSLRPFKMGLANGDVEIGEMLTIIHGGGVGIGTSSPGSYKLYVNGGNAYFSGNVSVASLTDRTPYPKDLKTAYNAVLSMQRLPEGEYEENNKENQLDHSTLHSFIKSPDGEHRDLSATVSAQNEVIKDLISRIGLLESQNKELKQKLNEILELLKEE